MHINYGEVVVQVIGFLIALAILRRYAWKPILGMLDERREKIQASLTDAEQKSREAQDIRAELEEQLRGIETTARAKIQEAAREGQTVATEIRNQAREEAKSILSRAREEVEREVERGRTQLKEDIVRIAMSAAEKLLGESLDDARQRRLIEQFVDDVDKAKQ
jgi:F-type H+-transporting ATPase subunit b